MLWNVSVPIFNPGFDMRLDLCRFQVVLLLRVPEAKFQKEFRELVRPNCFVLFLKHIYIEKRNAGILLVDPPSTIA